ncbi:antibiotic biosynthesis monooxygenase [Streptomyces sp. Ru73]|uniref:antibiotic biosynthesis monooxygenase family protein n=1 Tax=Streptomyces sp. Ru73 TaxID=2080748 RepID=UPI000CDD35CD|nr:antibiotic biosynthesis monooxygenase [Streptomyces sp. Ru73]POX42884.1 antibiotic biosynthesis monooxygenase [Streptomyces sp. Ru73]
MSGSAAPAVEVVLYHLADRGPDIVAAYHEASRRMAGTPGLLGNQLMNQVGRPDSYVVVSYWDSWESFETWEAGAGHKDQTAPLRAFRDVGRERPFEIYKVLARY